MQMLGDIAQLDFSKEMALYWDELGRRADRSWLKELSEVSATDPPDSREHCGMKSNATRK